MNNNLSSFKEIENEEGDDEEFLALSLSTGSRSPKPVTSLPLGSSPLGHDIFQPPCLHSTPPLSPQNLLLQQQFSIPPPPPPPSHHLYMPLSSSGPSASSRQELAGPSRPSRVRRSPNQTFRQGKREIIPASYPWATARRATIHSLDYLLSNGIHMISGEVQCKRCEQQYDIEYDLQQKFMEVASFISENRCTMHDRAPVVWMNPTLPNCKFCEQNNCVKPVLSKKRSINWLFLLLGQMLGCCKLSELKYFCKHTKNHRTGAKDRVLYLTYLGLCKQLDPNGPFDL